jgi:ribonuclease D
LLQISTSSQDILVDPLALLDLSPLGSIFANGSIQKIFHAAEYDLACLKRDFSFSFANLFDTMIAARILGIKEVGLGSLLSKEFGIILNKRYQRANWGQRPLSPELIAYAQQDTHYLVALRDHLQAQLEARDLMVLAEEDFARLCCAEPNGDHEASPCWSINGSHDLKPQQLAVLQELCWYREQMAADMDRPIFKVIGSHTLVAIAAACPTSLDELRGIPGMSAYQVQRHGRALLQAVRRGLQAEPVHLPRPPRPDGRFLNRLDALRTWRKQTALKWGVESDVVLPRDLMQAIAEHNPATSEDLSGILDCSPWRLQTFGDQILTTIKR